MDVARAGEVARRNPAATATTDLEAEMGVIGSVLLLQRSLMKLLRCGRMIFMMMRIARFTKTLREMHDTGKN